MRLLPGVEYPQLERIDSKSGLSAVVKSIELSPTQEVTVTDSGVGFSLNVTWNDVTLAIHDGRSGVAPKEYILRVVSCLTRHAPNSGWIVLLIDEDGFGWEMTYNPPQEGALRILTRGSKASEPVERPTRFDREDVI